MNPTPDRSPGPDALPRRFALRRQICCSAAAFAAAFAATGTRSLSAATFPSRPSSMIVSFPPGGPNDLLARLTAQLLSQRWPYPVVVENRVGALGIIGAQTAARAAPDGHTLFLGGVNHAILAALRTNLPYDLTRDFTPVCQVAAFPIILIANKDLPVSNVKELIAYAKARPGELTFGAGPGGPTHLSGELFGMQTGTKLLFVPYKGSAPAVVDLIGGQIQLMFSDAPTALPHLQAGRVKAFGIATAARSPLVPDLPTISEAGVPGFAADSWSGVLLPAGTPAEIVEKVNGDIVKGLDDPAIGRRLTEMGAQRTDGTPDAFRRYIASEIAKWAEIGRAAGIKLES